MNANDNTKLPTRDEVNAFLKEHTAKRDADLQKAAAKTCIDLSQVGKTPASYLKANFSHAFAVPAGCLVTQCSSVAPAADELAAILEERAELTAQDETIAEIKTFIQNTSDFTIEQVKALFKRACKVLPDYSDAEDFDNLRGLPHIYDEGDLAYGDDDVVANSEEDFVKFYGELALDDDAAKEQVALTIVATMLDSENLFYSPDKVLDRVLEVSVREVDEEGAGSWVHVLSDELTADTTDEEIEALVEKAEAELAAMGCVDNDSLIEAALTEKRTELKTEARKAHNEKVVDEFSPEETAPAECYDAQAGDWQLEIWVNSAEGYGYAEGTAQWQNGVPGWYAKKEGFMLRTGFCCCNAAETALDELLDAMHLQDITEEELLEYMSTILGAIFHGADGEIEALVEEARAEHDEDDGEFDADEVAVRSDYISSDQLAEAISVTVHGLKQKADFRKYGW